MRDPLCSALGGAALLLAGCGGGPPIGSTDPDASPAIADAAADSVDAGPDAAPDDRDAGPSRADAGADAGPDAGTDAGPIEPVACDPIDDFVLEPEDGDVEEASAAPLADGFVIVYAIRVEDRDVLRMGLLDPCAGPVASGLPVDESGRFIAGARAAALPDGGFLVGWTQVDGDPTDDGVVLQTFEADGRPRSAVTTANQTENAGQYLEGAVALPDGAALAWVDHSPADFRDRPDAVLRVFDDDGHALSDEILLSPGSDGRQDLPRLGATADGELLVAYHEPSLSGRLRRRSADGEWLDAEPTVVSEDRREVSGIAAADDRFAIAIVSHAVEESGDVELGLLTADTGAFEVVSISATPDVGEADARVAALPDGGLLVAWTDRSLIEDESGRGVLALRTLADGTPDGARFVVPSETAFDQTLQSLAAGPGGVLAVWIDDSQADGHHGEALRARLLVHDLVEVAQ